MSVILAHVRRQDRTLHPFFIIPYIAYGHKGIIEAGFVSKADYRRVFLTLIFR